MKILVEGKGLRDVKKVWYNEDGLNCKISDKEDFYFPTAPRSAARDVKSNACTDLTQYKCKVRRNL